MGRCHPVPALRLVDPTVLVSIGEERARLLAQHPLEVVAHCRVVIRPEMLKRRQDQELGQRQCCAQNFKAGNARGLMSEQPD